MANKPDNEATQRSEEPRLLSGGNPQIKKGAGEEPVQAYISAMPGWKSDAGARLDALIVEAIPGVAKAVKWNSPFYGTGDGRWLISFHCFAKYIKVTFFSGAHMTPVPPVGSKDAHVRYLHVFETEPLDEAQFRDWARQAVSLPGWQMK